MKRHILILSIVLFSLFTVAHADTAAEDNKPWYSVVWDSTKDTVHKMTTDDVTFESFYKESSSVGWILTGVLALLAIVTIIFTGGTGSPIVVSIGTWIGGTMGLSGAAATNAGLALLGGGSIASGGFGILGGTVVLTAALTFGTEVVVDYTVSKALDTYSYSNFSQNSKNMITLPLPKNSNGSDIYEGAMDLIEEIDAELPLSSKATQLTIKRAIDLLKPMPKSEYERAQSIVNEMGVSDTWNNPQRFNDAYDIANRYEGEKTLDNDERAKKESLLSVLYFISNDYRKAGEYAKKSISLASKENIKHTFPSYIYATSLLYEKSFNYDNLADEYLKYSFVNESNNPIIPLLLSIHLDRMMYRFGDGMIDEKALSKVYSIISDESLKDFRLQNYIIILSRYIVRLKLEQQKISSLSAANNKTIKNSPKSLVSVEKSYESYEYLIDGAKDIVKSLEIIEVEDEKDIETKKQVNTFKELIAQYDNDKTRLHGLVQDLEAYQSSLSIEEVEEIPETQEVEIVKDDKNIYLYIGFSIIFLIMMMLFIIRKKRVEGISKNFNLKVK